MQITEHAKVPDEKDFISDDMVSSGGSAPIISVTKKPVKNLLLMTDILIAQLK
ncbi:hypothetical protein D3C84_976050 [compost metagenome]